jgi:hypothetical protein
MIIKKFNPWSKIATISFHDLFPDVQIKILDNFIVKNAVDVDNPDFDTYITGFAPTTKDIEQAFQNNESKSKILVFVSQKSLDNNANLQPALDRAGVLSGGRFSYTTTNRVGTFNDILYDYQDHDTFINIIKNNAAIHKLWAFTFNLTDKFLMNQWVKTTVLERYQAPQLPYSIKTTNTVIPTEEIEVRNFFSQNTSVIVKPINGYNTIEKSYTRKVYTDADSFLNDVVLAEGNLNRFFTNQRTIRYYWKANDQIPVMLQEYFDAVDLDFVYTIAVNKSYVSRPDDPTNFKWLTTKADPAISQLLNRYVFFVHCSRSILIQIKGVRVGNNVHLLDVSFGLDPLLSSTNDIDTIARNIIFMYLRN